MEMSLFLAKLIGLYTLIVGLLCIFRKKEITATSKQVVASRSTLMVSASICLIFGLAIAIGHPVWEYTWRGLITVLGYFMIVKGILRMAFPEAVKKRGLTMLNKGFWPTITIILVIGAYLTYSGFVHAA